MGIGSLTPMGSFWRMSIGMRPIPPAPAGFSVMRLRYPGSSTTAELHPAIKALQDRLSRVPPKLSLV